MTASTPKSKRLRQWIRRRFFIRFHMTLIVLATVAAGVLWSTLLFSAGVTSMPLRYGLAAIGSYAVFFLAVRLWLAYVESQRSGPVGPSAADGIVDGVAEAIGGMFHGSTATGAGSGDAGGGETGGGGGFSLDVDGEGAVVLIIFGALVVAVLGAGVYLVWQAPLILSEAAVEFFLVAALRRSSKRMDSGSWLGSVLRTTWMPALFVLTLAVGTGFALEGVCPEATTVSEAMDCPE